MAPPDELRHLADDAAEGLNFGAGALVAGVGAFRRHGDEFL